MALDTTRNAETIEAKAIELIPEELPKLMQRAFSLRTRALLIPRDFQSIANGISNADILQASLIRFWASELIGKAGIKAKYGLRSLSKTPEYNQAKLKVRAAIIKCISSNSDLHKQFEAITKKRAEKSLFARARKIVRRRRKP